jgi:uncharacterized protein
MPAKAVILDIETTSLEADGGIVVGVGLAPEEGGSEYLQVNRSRDEADVLSKMAQRLQSYEVLVTWNGRGFDIPFLTTRLLKNGLDPRPISSKRHVDLNEVVKSRLRLTFTYLDHVCDFLGIAKKKGPMGMDVPQLYVRALEGDTKALDAIRDHCLDDLQATRNVYLRLKPLVEQWIAQ